MSKATGTEKPKPAQCPEPLGQANLIAHHAGETSPFSSFSFRPMLWHKLTIMALREEEHAIPTPNTCGRLRVGAPFHPSCFRLIIASVGGWWVRPSNWASNTVVAGIGIAVITYGVWSLSAKLEVR